MKRWKSVFMLASVYIGTIIGAGFASGQEIIQFFARHGSSGIFGIIVIAVLFSLLGVTLLKTTYVKKISSLEEYLFLYFKKRTIIFINVWLIAFLFVSYFIMLAGSGAIFREHFQINQLFGVAFMSVACFVVFLTGVKGIAKANTFLIPFILAIICFIGAYVLYYNNYMFSQWTTESMIIIKEHNFKISNYIWFGSAILYVAFNSISAVVVLTSLGTLIEDKTAAIYGGVLGGIGLGTMALMILLSLLIFYTDIIGLEIPMVAVASSLGEGAKKTYSLVLLISMFTTAIANGYGCVLRISNLLKIKEVIISFIICSTSIPMAALGFKRLVSFFYPIFGYLGVIFIGVIVMRGQKEQFKEGSKDFQK